MLPQGFIARHATMDDVSIVVDFYNQIAVEENRPADTTIEDVRYQWQFPDFNPETDIQLIFAPDGALAGYIEVGNSDPYVTSFVWGRVLHTYQRLGIGDHMLRWSEDRVCQSFHKAPPDARITMVQGCINTNQDACGFLETQGFKANRFTNTMLIEMTAPPPAPVVPEGIVIRLFRYETEFETVLHTFREAFRDHWGHVERPFEDTKKDWQHMLDSDPTGDPSLWFVAMDGAEMAGVSLGSKPRLGDPDVMGWINILAVRRPWRKRGIALALLHTAFGEYYRRGIVKVGLGADSQNLTGAIRLYEKAGMHVERCFVEYEKELRPGREVGVQALNPDEA
ncbi:MAG: GNAT family N-acetyltransferase [Anaerolineae bacterium]|nr:GNAT family N-acetyltransferase [Anaerolineae bacterium]